MAKSLKKVSCLHDSCIIIQQLPKLLVHCFLIRCSKRTLRIGSLVSHLGERVQKLRTVLGILVLCLRKLWMLKLGQGRGWQNGRAGVSTQTWWLQPLPNHITSEHFRFKANEAPQYCEDISFCLGARVRTTEAFELTFFPLLNWEYSKPNVNFTLGLLIARSLCWPYDFIKKLQLPQRCRIYLKFYNSCRTPQR